MIRTALETRWLFVALAWLSSLGLLLAGFGSVQGDVVLYWKTANQMLEGGEPYLDFEFEYPPLALPLALAPRLIAKGLRDYQMWWMAGMAACDLLGKLLVLRWLGPGPRALGALACLSAIGFANSHHILQRMDLLPALCLLMAAHEAREGRGFPAAAWLSLGAGVKAFPMLAAPSLWIVLRPAPGQARRFLATLALTLAAALLMDFFLPWHRFALFHSARGFHVESFWGGYCWLAKLTLDLPFQWVGAAKWMEVAGASESAVTFARASWIALTLVGVAAPLLVRAARSSAEDLSTGILASLLCFMALSPVFSPQFLFWVAPFICLNLANRAPGSVVLLMACLVTPVWYPSPFYWEGLQLPQTAALCARNTIILACGLLCLRQATRGRSSRTVRPSPAQP